MKNKLTDLNNHLFTQLERVNSDELSGDELKHEVNRSKAIVGIGKAIVDNARLVLDAHQAMSDPDIKASELPTMLTGKKEIANAEG